MKVSITLSVDVETAEIIKEARKQGFTPSHVFQAVMKSLAENDYKYPIHYEPKSVI